MKHEPESRSGDLLDETLHRWTISAPLPVRFRDQVWQRIAQSETGPRETAWGGLTRLIEVLLPRPAIAFSCLAAFVLAGMAAGSWTAQVSNSRVDMQLSSRYVQSIDPAHLETSHP
jgi:hypothetical protein